MSSNMSHEEVSPSRRIAILGLGQMGMVCAGMLSAKDKPGGVRGGETSIVMWGHSAEEADALAQTRASKRLAGFELPASVRVTTKAADALKGADLIVSAIPVQHIREVWTSLGKFVEPHAGIVSVAKGIENSTLLRPTQITTGVLRELKVDDPDKKPRRVGVLSGPTIATELARCLPAAMIAASDDAAFAVHIQRTFATSWLRVYTNPDVAGVELAGAVKNVIAIAAGVVDGLQAGNNAKSAMLARGLAEITRLGVALGANAETFFGVAGVGDLATSCFSPEGRNRSCGEALGRGRKLNEYLAESPYVVEGVATCKSVVELAAKYRVDMPIAHAVHSILFDDVDPIEAIGMLMSREQKAEHVG
ncbi:MAG: NAD(P)H-dependent glycerol-3-phosphate dehydrogenase [Phycisphaerales bacterium]